MKALVRFGIVLLTAGAAAAQDTTAIFDPRPQGDTSYPGELLSGIGCQFTSNLTVTANGGTRTANFSCRNLPAVTVTSTVTVSPTTIRGVPSGAKPVGTFNLTTPLTVDVTTTVTGGNANAPTSSFSGSPDNGCVPKQGGATLTLTCSPRSLSRYEDGFSPVQDYLACSVDVKFDSGGGTANVEYIVGVCPYFKEVAAADSVSLTSVNPPGGALDPQKLQKFTASAQYALNSSSTGTITLVLTDQNNKTIASSNPVTVNKGSGTTATLTIDGTTTPASGTLTLKALLHTSSGDTTSAGVNYTIGAAPDDISLTDVSPAAGELPGKSSQRFSAGIRYTLNSTASGTVQLELADQTGAVIARSAGQSVNRGGSPVTETISITLPDTATRLTLKGVLHAGTDTKDSSTVTYTVAPASCSITGADAPSRPRAAAEDCAAIRLQGAIPLPVHKLLAFADELPPFCAFGQFNYLGPNQADISLELVEESGAVLAQSAKTRLPGGAKQNWGGACNGGKELVFIQERSMPPFFIPPGATYDQPIGVLSLRAVLSDSVTAQRLATSGLVSYTVVPGVTLEAALYYKPNLTGPESPYDLSFPLLNNDPGWGLRGALDPYRELFLKTRLDFAGSEGLLTGSVVTTDSSGKELANALTVEDVDVDTGHTEKNLKIDGPLPKDTTAVAIQPKLILLDGLIVRGPRTNVKVESVRATYVSSVPCPATTTYGKCTQVGGEIAVSLTVFSSRPNQSLRRRVRYFPIPTTMMGSPPISEETTNVDSRISAGSLVTVQDYVSIDDVLDTGTVQVVYELLPSGGACPCATEITGFTLVSTVTPTAGTTAKSAAATLGVDRSGTSTPVQITRVPTPIGAFEAGILDLLKTRTAAANPARLAINSTWLFNPPIPRNGTFSARLSLHYSPTDFPDHPSFSEALLQVISVDATGAVRVYPTTLDLTNKIATAQIDSLEQSYSLAVIGPFAQSSVSMASSPTGYALVNTGAQSAGISLAEYSLGTATPANTTLRATSQTKKESHPEWVQVWSDLPAVEGVSFSDIGPQFAVTPSAAAGQLFAFTGVEYATGKSTRFNVANPTPFDALVRINLKNPDGTERGSYATTIPAKRALAADIETLFSPLPKDFAGYAIVASEQAVLASGVFTMNSTAAGLVAQPMTTANLAPTSRFAVRPADTSVATTLHLVNLGTATANLTLRARTAAGTSAAPNVSIQLLVGRQHSRALADIFNLAETTIASIQVDSDIPGVLGDLLTTDSRFIPQSLASLPLTTESRLSSVLPYVTPATTVYLYNPNSTTATVGVTSVAADGTRGTTTSESVPAFGRAVLGAPSNAAAYLTISSTQPVTAVGSLTNASATTTAYLALPSASVTTPPAPGALPAATAAGVVNAGSFQGGTVSPGEIVTIFGSNFGTSALTLLSLLSNGRVATDGAQTRFLFDNVAAPIVYVVTGQASVIVPYSVAGKTTTQLVVEYQGRRSDPITLDVASAAPGLFAANSSGTGPGAILNQNSSVNTPQNPAAKGSVVVLFGTGEGSTNPQVLDGSVTPGIVQPVLPVTVTIGGLAQKVLYAGAAPSLVAGVLQVNVEIDAATPGGNQPVVVTVGGVASQSGLTVAIAGSGPAQAPVIVLEPTSLDFLSVPVGQTKDLVVTIRNTGNANLTVSSITSSNPRFAAVIQNPPLTVGPGSFQQATIRFSPTAAGAQTGTLTFASNDPANASRTMSVTGTGTAASAPVIVLEPTSLDFGTVTSGQTKDLVVTIRNNGTANLTVSSITSTSARFAAVIQTPPLTAGPGSFQFTTIRYSPTSAGSETATLTFASNDPATPSRTMTVTGTGTAVAAPVIALEPTSLDFQSVAVGQTKDLVVTIRNNGTANLTVSSITSTSARFAAVIQTPPLTAGPGSFQGTTIRYSPTSAGAETATLTFASNDPANPSRTMTVTGTGTGAAAAPVIVLDPTSLDYGTVAAGQTKDLFVTIRNNGNANLTVTTITSSNPRFAAVIQNPPLTAGPGSFQFSTIRFSPISSAADSATITFASNDPARPNATLSVTGNAGGSSGGGATVKRTLTSAAGWPNPRTSNQIPALAIDGSTATYTWTTESFNAAAPSYLGVSMAASTSVSRLRIYKDNDAGGPGLIAKNLTIEYTTSDPSIPLASRVWTSVSGLVNGFNGTELMTATAVNTNGTVTADNHVSQTSGFASLTFTPVNATGIRIGFSNSTPIAVNHYRVYEFELYGSAP